VAVDKRQAINDQADDLVRCLLVSQFGRQP
jgi:hypothetical protein